MNNQPTINTKNAGDSGYIAFYNGKRCEVYARSSYSAQRLAIEYFKAPKSKQYQVQVMVAERPDGSTVVHTGD